MVIAVLAVQGDFAEHEAMLRSLGAECFEIREKKDIERPFDGIVLPGGESTVQGKLLRELDLFDAVKAKIDSGIPVFGTCAGLILLAERLSNDENVYFASLPATVRRNAYGRQLGSFYAEEEFKGIGKIPMTFIRAPYIESVGEGVDVLAVVDGNIVAAKKGNVLGISFHPEVDGNNSVHRYFLNMVERSLKK